MPSTDGMDASSGDFTWECDGIDKILIERTGYVTSSAGTFRAHRGQMRTGAMVLTYYYNDVPGKTHPGVGSMENGEFKFANPAFCLQYFGVRFSDLVKDASVVSSRPDEVAMKGNLAEKPFVLTVRKFDGRWCLKAIRAPYSKASIFTATVDSWQRFDGDCFVPTGGSFWAGSEDRMGEAERFEAKGYAKSVKPIDYARVLPVDTVISSPDSTSIFGKDKQLHFLHRNFPRVDSGGNILFLVLAAGLFVGTIFVVWRVRKA